VVGFPGGQCGAGRALCSSWPPPGEFSLKALLVRVLVGTIMSAAVGATFYVPLMG